MQNLILIALWIIIFLMLVIIYQNAYGESLGCVDLNKPMVHIHTKSEPETYPAYIGVPPEFGGDDKCIREMHTHAADGWLHLESNNQSKVFTLRPFMDLLGNGTMGYSSLTINGRNATFDTPLKNMDKVVIH